MNDIKGNSDDLPDSENSTSDCEEENDQVDTSNTVTEIKRPTNELETIKNDQEDTFLNNMKNLFQNNMKHWKRVTLSEITHTSTKKEKIYKKLVFRGGPMIPFKFIFF